MKNSKKRILFNSGLEVSPLGPAPYNCCEEIGTPAMGGGGGGGGGGGIPHFQQILITSIEFAHKIQLEHISNLTKNKIDG